MANYPSDAEIWGNMWDAKGLSEFGAMLEKAGIAMDKVPAFDGSFEALESYSGSNRYVSFVEVKKSSLSGKFSDPGLSFGAITMGVGLGVAMIPMLEKDSDSGTKSTFMGGGIALAAVGGALAAIPGKSTMKYKGEFVINVYDTVEKELVKSEEFSVSLSEKIKGDFFNAKSNKASVYAYFSNLVANEIAKKYAEIEF